MDRNKIWRKCRVVFGIILLIGTVCYTIFNRLTVPDVSSLKEEISDEIQKIKQKGEPITIEELTPEDIPDEENGALFYRQVFDLMEKEESKELKDMAYTLCMKALDKWTREEKGKATSAVEKNKNIYVLLEKACKMKCQFLKREDYEKGTHISTPHLNSLRSCGRLLAIKAKVEAENGEIDKALNTCLTGLKVAKAVSGEPLILCQLIRTTLDQFTLITLEDILGNRVGNKDLYQALIEAIRKERRDKITYFALLGERVAYGIQEWPRIKEEAVKDKRMRAVLGKNFDRFFDEDQLVYLKTMDKVILLAKSLYWEVTDELQRFDDEMEKLHRKKAMLTRMLVPALPNAYTLEARLDAQLGNAEIALACHVYKTKYGDYPSSLKKLIPEILPSLPIDPFTGKDYIYREKDEEILIYSLADNMKDDGGISVREKKFQGDFDIVWRLKR